MSISATCSVTSRMVILKKGNLTSDGSEQVLLEFLGIGKISGYVDLSSMAAEDTVIIKQYFKALSTSSYQKYAEETYVGVQDNPMLHITPKESDVALKITLQQTIGYPKRFLNNFMKEM